ncbi:hypothetical protein [Shouchella lehensis]|uniref:Uncharacterized protein n=1 Tax=Shouchella lehensis G1 TaxID=1246626 RepID=A0A060LYZ1_9BACI|nr:hypothetical protein [Shouchella lehensis]AIC95412.1 hypothetical protein BleG1_2848 [Shouchella lehensis G1]
MTIRELLKELLDSGQALDSDLYVEFNDYTGDKEMDDVDVFKMELAENLGFRTYQYGLSFVLEDHAIVDKDEWESLVKETDDLKEDVEEMETRISTLEDENKELQEQLEVALEKR